MNSGVVSVHWKELPEDWGYEQSTGECRAPAPYSIEYPRYTHMRASEGEGCPCWAPSDQVLAET